MLRHKIILGIRSPDPTKKTNIAQVRQKQFKQCLTNQKRSKRFLVMGWQGYANTCMSSFLIELFCVQTFSVADIKKYRTFLAFENLSLRIHLYLLIVYMYIEIVLRSRLCLTSINVFVTRRNYPRKKTWQIPCCENIQISFPQVLFYFKSIYNYSHVIGWKERYMHI